MACTGSPLIGDGLGLRYQWWELECTSPTFNQSLPPHFPNPPYPKLPTNPPPPWAPLNSAAHSATELDSEQLRIREADLAPDKPDSGSAADNRLPLENFEGKLLVVGWVAGHSCIGARFESQIQSFLGFLIEFDQDLLIISFPNIAVGIIHTVQDRRTQEQHTEPSHQLLEALQTPALLNFENREHSAPIDSTTASSAPTAAAI